MRTRLRFAIPALFLAVAQTSASGQDRIGEKYGLVRYKQVQTTEMAGGEVGETTSTLYANLKSGARRQETTWSNQLAIQVWDPTNRRHLMTNPEKMTAVLFPFDPVTDKSLLEFVRTFPEMKGVAASEEELDSRSTRRYVLKDKAKGTVFTLWVDAKTRLPVREEFEEREPIANPQIKLNKYVMSDFEWDPKIKDADGLFKSTPPRGYTVEDRTQKHK
jgi:hypothetical protein